MPSRLRLLPVIATIAAFVWAAPVMAQDEPTAATVVATVGETEITLGHMLALRNGLPPHYDQLPEEVLFKGILDQLVQQTLLMQMVQDEPTALTRLMLENEHRAILASQAIRAIMEKPVDEETLQAAYAERFAGHNPDTEYHAAHILVATEEEARDLVEQLSKGADFSDLAKTHSTGPSGPNGGDLGWFGPGVMVEPFFDAVLKLESGQVTDPVETQFGWHVIKLIESRVPDIPKLDDVREELLEELRQKAFDDLLAKREAEAAIDRSNAENIDQSIINKTDILEK